MSFFWTTRVSKVKLHQHYPSRNCHPRTSPRAAPPSTLPRTSERSQVKWWRECADLVDGFEWELGLCLLWSKCKITQTQNELQRRQISFEEFVQSGRFIREWFPGWFCEPFNMGWRGQLFEANFVEHPSSATTMCCKMLRRNVVGLWEEREVSSSLSVSSQQQRMNYDSSESFVLPSNSSVSA